MTLTIVDTDGRRKQPLEVHQGLSPTTARELMAVYRALGYRDEQIILQDDDGIDDRDG